MRQNCIPPGQSLFAQVTGVSRLCSASRGSWVRFPSSPPSQRLLHGHFGWALRPLSCQKRARSVPLLTVVLAENAEPDEFVSLPAGDRLEIGPGAAPTQSPSIPAVMTARRGQALAVVEGPTTPLGVAGNGRRPARGLMGYSPSVVAMIWFHSSASMPDNESANVKSSSMVAPCPPICTNTPGRSVHTTMSVPT